MSLLLIAPPHELGGVLIERLISEDDEVRVIEPRPDRAQTWRDLGAHVAAGPIDADLVERAAYNTRTVVVFDAAELREILEGVLNAGVGRLVMCTPRLDRGAIELIAQAGVDYVALASGRFRRRSADEVAAAIDAADDLQGEPRLTVDLTSRDGRAHLGLTEASGKRGR
jgi:uncharacterized protein YbjT (DUF2867 family)